MLDKKNGALEFFEHEAAGGIVLLFAAALALIAANTPLAGFYDRFLDTPVAVKIGALELAKPLRLWINDGLMAIFFLLIGLELKREAVEGSLRDPRVAALPMCGALGGVAIPVAIHAAIPWNDPVAPGRWAIPAATDRCPRPRFRSTRSTSTARPKPAAPRCAI